MNFKLTNLKLKRILFLFAALLSLQNGFSKTDFFRITKVKKLTEKVMLKSDISKSNQLTESKFNPSLEFASGDSNTKSQTEKATLVLIFSKLSQQTDYKFSYGKAIIDDNKVYTVNYAESVVSILNGLIKNANINYSIKGKLVLIQKNTDKTARDSKAENIKVKGRIVDENSKPIPGATVLEANSSNSTITDFNGEFELSVAEKKTIEVSYLGYKTKAVTVQNNFMIIQLQPNTSELKEVVVIGYGKQTKSKVTGSISQIKSEDLNRVAGSSFANQIAGKAAGVVINEASGQPGTNPKIVIRGIGTLTAGTNTLIVVDGFPLSEGSGFNSINPQDIETIDVLKDPASAAIYGSRAANGVVLVTTKKGKEDKLTVSFDHYTGFQERADKSKYVNAYDAAQFFTEARDWGYVSKDPANRSVNDDRATRIAKGASRRELRLNYLTPYLKKQPGLTNTYWPDEIFRTAPMTNYNLAISKGNSKSSFYSSFNYFDQKGIAVDNDYKRYSGTFKIDSKLSDKVDFSVSLNPSYSKQHYLDGDTNPIGGLQLMYPFFSPYDPDGSLAISEQLNANIPEDGALGENIIALIKKIKNDRTFFRTFGNTFLSYEPISGLKLKALFGGDIRNDFYDYYNPSDVGAYRVPAPKPSTASETKDSRLNYLIENTINYNKTFGSHNIDALVGYTYQEENGTSTKVTGSGIPDDNITNIAGASAFTATASRYKWTQVSFLARLQYAFRDKYLFSATIRRDGSSRFGDENKWGNFPSVTAGWIMTKEDFFPENDMVTFVKLRGSYGLSGNNQIGSYSSKGLLGLANYVYGNNLGSGFIANTTPNPNLTWETKNSLNLGLNITLFNKLNLSADYYVANTKDLLLDVPVPEQSGFSSSIQNIGKVKNKGFEFELTSYAIDLGSVKWTLNANIATNSNKVLELAPGQERIIAGPEGNFVTRVGGPIAEMSGYNIIGVYKSQSDVDSTPHLKGTLVGDYKVEDVNGDGVIDQNDMKFFGTFNPKFTYGFGSSFSYKNFELNFSFNGVEGRKIYDRSAALYNESGEGFSVPNKYYFENRYHPIDNPDGFLAQPNYGNFSSARKLVRASSLFYKDADYLRLRNIQLSYNLPKSLLSKLKMANMRFYISANNLFTFTKYLGFNPEGTTPDTVLTDGYADSSYPIAKSLILGINLTL